MAKVNLKFLVTISSLGSLFGLLASTCFALGPIIQLNLIKVHFFELPGMSSPETTAVASSLIAKSNCLAVQKAVLEHGYESMTAGALTAGCAYLAIYLLRKFLIDGPSSLNLEQRD